MDDKYIYSGIGILLGWVLKEISTLGARQFERKQKLGHAIASLMSFYRETILLRANLNLWRSQSPSLASYERVRQYVSTSVHKRTSHMSKSLDDALKTVSLYYPLDAEKLDSTIAGLDFHNTIKLDESSKIKELYVTHLSILGIALDMAVKRLGGSLSKLAFKHGLMTWLKIRKELKRIEKRDLAEAAKPLLDPMFDELSKMQTARPKDNDNVNKDE